jgi:hypothetical protein
MTTKQTIQVREPRVQASGQADRRASLRFPLETELRYSRGPMTGSGQTFDMSSIGVSFTTERYLPLGMRLNLAIDWPVRMTNGVRLQLIIDGAVVRSDRGFIAVRFGRGHYEFKTRGGR